MGGKSVGQQPVGVKASVKPLGPTGRTDRGFEIIEFKDRYGVQCELQQSSLAEYVKPGTSAVWIGVAGEDRMHLDRPQVSALIMHLTEWLTRDTFDSKSSCDDRIPPCQ